MVVIAVLFVIAPYIFAALAQVSGSADHYVQVDQDVWGFLKYVGLLFMGLLIYIGREIVLALKSLIKSFNALNVTVSVNNEDVKHIKDDVSEIKETITRHDTRINTLEKNQKN